MKKSKITPRVIQKENEEPVTVEIIAQSIKKIGDAVEQMNRSNLSDRAIRVLLRDASGENMQSIRNILRSLRELKSLYLKG